MVTKPPQSEPSFTPTIAPLSIQQTVIRPAIYGALTIMPAQFPFFQLVENNRQAEIALSAMTCFGSEHERKILKHKR